MIRVRCYCGQPIDINEHLVDRDFPCPSCGKFIRFTREQFNSISTSTSTSTPSPTASESSSFASNAGSPVNGPDYSTGEVPEISDNPLAAQTLPVSPLRRIGIYFFLLALIPLIISAFIKDKPLPEIIDSAMENPEFQQALSHVDEAQLDAMDLKDLLNLYPGHKFPGAFLSSDTMAHWVFALVSAGLFAGAILLIFRCSQKYFLSFILRGLFTATFGIILLLGFQIAADFTLGYNVTGRGLIVLLFYLVKLIGFSYRCASAADIGFLGSFFGYTVGVGLCEEICKVLPVLFGLKKNRNISWRFCCLVGLASGVGFGVSEGVHYSSNMYNGVLPGDIYLVRFLSCVSLHALWAGASAMLVFRNRNALLTSDSYLSAALRLALYCLPSILLHGAYNTLLKFDRPALALIPAVLAFGYFLWVFNATQKTQRDVEKENPPGLDANSAMAG